MFKNALKHEYIFKSLVLVGFLVTAFGAWQVSIGVKNWSDKSSAEQRVVNEKRKLVKQETEIENIKESYENKPASSPFNITEKGHIILQEIRSIGKNYNLTINYSARSTSSRSAVSFSPNNLNMDNSSGLRKFEGNMSIKYDRYQDFKDFMNKIKENYPITIDSLTMGQSSTQVGFSLYGN